MFRLMGNLWAKASNANRKAKREVTYAKRHKDTTVLTIAWNVLLTLCTGGIWLIVLLIMRLQRGR